LLVVSEKPECGKSAQWASGKCKAHGGGKRSLEPECGKGAAAGAGLCEVGGAAAGDGDEGGGVVEAKTAGLKRKAPVAEVAAVVPTVVAASKRGVKVGRKAK
jgi:hypothetical protein